MADISISEVQELPIQSPPANRINISFLLGIGSQRIPMIANCGMGESLWIVQLLEDVSGRWRQVTKDHHPFVGNTRSVLDRTAAYEAGCTSIENELNRLRTPANA